MSAYVKPSVGWMDGWMDEMDGWMGWDGMGRMDGMGWVYLKRMDGMGCVCMYGAGQKNNNNNNNKRCDN